MALDYSMILNKPDFGRQLTDAATQYSQMQAYNAQAAQAQQEQEMMAQQAAQAQEFLGAMRNAKGRGELAALAQQYPGQLEILKGVAGFQNDLQAEAVGELSLTLGDLLESGQVEAAEQTILQNEDVLSSMGQGYTAPELIEQLRTDPASFARRADMLGLISVGPEKAFEIIGQREGREVTRRGQDITVRGQNIRQAEGAANRQNAMNIKQLTLADKALDREVQRLGQLASAETNDLRRQELELKLQEKQQKLTQTRQDMDARNQSTAFNISEAARLANELASDPNLDQAVGTIDAMSPVLRASTQDIINKADRLQSLLTVDNLKLMTGVLTDRDISFLTNVASGLNVTDKGIKGSEREVKKRLGEIATKMQEKIESLPQAARAPAGATGSFAPPAPAGSVDVDALINKYAPR